MDKDFEKKVKQKRVRGIALVVIAVVVIGALFFGTKIERPAQYVSNGSEDGGVAVTVEIRCDSLSEDLSKLTNKSLEKYVPEDGTILDKTQVIVEEGESVYDALYKVCRENDIHMESSYTKVYESYYVEGINYLYEFDGGKLSGWMFMVNGEYPNYGASAIKVKEGDEIKWIYTCDLGKDVGNEFDDEMVKNQD